MRAKRSTWKCLSACYVTCIICLYVPLAFHTCNIVMEMILTYFRAMFLSHENRTFDFAIKPVDWFLQRVNIGLEMVKNMLALFIIQASSYSFVMV